MSDSARHDTSRAQPPKTGRKSDPAIAPEGSSEVEAILAAAVTVRPLEYSDAQRIGDAARDGVPTIIDLSESDDALAKRMVDFAAGLAFAMWGSIDKLRPRTFLLTTHVAEPVPQASQQESPSERSGSDLTSRHLRLVEGLEDIGDVSPPAASISVRPSTYRDARVFADRFRAGEPVLLILTSISSHEAKRLIDFAAGLVYARRGSIDKVAPLTYLLTQSGMAAVDDIDTANDSEVNEAPEEGSPFLRLVVNG